MHFNVNITLINPDEGTFCSTNDTEGLVLVMDDGYGSCSNFEPACFDATAPASDHFAGVINYGKNALESFVDKCGITIPWIRGTGDLGLDDNDCISIENTVNVSRVVSGLAVDESTSCYRVSNSSLYPGNCPVQYPDGPSFFDRLDGNYNLSQKYRNQANSTFGNPWIGIETMIDLEELEYYGLSVNSTATRTDYLYWKNSPGNETCGICLAGDYGFRLDCQHMLMYNMSVCG